MSNSYSVNVQHLHGSGSYGENLWHAFQIFLTALCNVKTNANPDHPISEQDREISTKEIYQLAKQFDKTMPNQAAELRDLASRDC